MNTGTRQPTRVLDPCSARSGRENEEAVSDVIGHMERCAAAIERRAPAVVEAMSFIASGRAIIEVNTDSGDVTLDSIDGKPVRDPEFPKQKMGLAGSWPLYHGGLIDQYGLPTKAGLDWLSEPPSDGGT